MRSFSLPGVAALTAAAACGQLGTVDIHPSAPNTILEMRTRFFRGHYELRNATLVDLIDTAWSVDPDKLVGGPDWLDTDRFDLAATAPADSTPEALKAMLREFLAARFHLVVRKDTRPQPAYAMTTAGKPQLKPSDSDAKTGCETRQTTRTTVAAECRNITMAAFAKALPGIREASGYLFNYPVADRTGLTGAWDFTLQWTPRLAMRANPATPEPVTLFDALEKQLGLKLSLSKIPTPVVVVESIAEIEPTPADKPLAPLQFEVADIKPDAPGAPDQCSQIAIEPGGRVRINMTLKGLISEAWGAMDPAKIFGGPKSLNDTCFVILAKAPAEEGAEPGWNGPVWNGVDIHSMRIMLRAFLIDRFKLAAHTEDRPLSGYALTSATPKLRKASPTNRASCREGPGDDGKDPRIANPMASRLITCRNMTLARFAAEMNRIFVELPPVVDSTGLTGRYDMTINFSPAALLPKPADPAVSADALASEPNGVISFPEALRKQLGLKFESRKVMAPALFTAAQAAAGKLEYQNDCYRCHTDKLTGRVGDPSELPTVSSLDAEAQTMIQANGGNVPALTGPRFMARWGAKTTQDLTARIKIAAGLDAQRYLNITAYVLEFNGARPGAQALTKDTAVEVQSVVNQQNSK